MSTGAVQRELAGLCPEAGLLTVTKQGNQKHYQANASAPVFAELRGLVLKTMGLADVLRLCAGTAGGSDRRCIYLWFRGTGSKTRRKSDVDVMIISMNLAYGEVFGALENAVTGPRSNPTLYTPADLAKRVQNDNSFVTRVWQQPKIWLIGTEEQPHAPSA